jgi:alkanesulfonate monooxygenase SsuD/methylene tetrahydromethanopterin reductase-like flavin-dependent oxidoreductase (luciferase family)
MSDIAVLLPRDLAPELVLDFARRAEELGFDELWVVEDLGFRGGIAQASAVLATTTRIRVGIGLLPVGARNVAFAAMEIATLAQLFPGRIDVTIGHGMPHWMRQAGAWPTSPMTLLREYTVALRALLTGETVTTNGEYVTLDGLKLSVVPAVPPRLFFGVRGPASLALSGELADGTVLAEPVTPEYLAAARDAINAVPHRIVAYNAAAVRDSREEAIEVVRPGLAWIGEPDWRPHIAPLDIADEFAALRARCADVDEFAQALPDEWVERLAVVGTRDGVRESIARLHAAGADCVVHLLIGDDPMTELERLAPCV